MTTAPWTPHGAADAARAEAVERLLAVSIGNVCMVWTGTWGD